ncbi:unnamed protein product [Mytilus edulis]|uniref:Uncharacterized protein n=1 Tax=Mytilus edulis TaxID=6550 RepID=A0A8S3THQ1_MYTED|nr:unnamed protein product [Mytilus edulis]
MDSNQQGAGRPHMTHASTIPPLSPTMDRGVTNQQPRKTKGESTNGVTNQQPRKTKRKSIKVILTRLCSAILIVMDCVSDWMQYNGMKPPLDLDGSATGCVNKDDIANKYMYFTIAGTILSVIQLANITFQIYCEVLYRREMKTGESSDEKTLGEKLDEKMKYPKKLLDGRTETFYSMLFIEIPQGLILLGYENACVSSCNVTNKNMKKGITAAVNGGMALFSNAFRFLTCSTLCEETVVDEGNEKSKYECTIPCCIFGKTCVCDMCRCYDEPFFCKIPFCFLFTFHYCPLKDPDDPKEGQRYCKVESNCCKCSGSDFFEYEPLFFHTFLATFFNVVYVVLYFFNVCKIVCWSPSVIGSCISFVQSINMLAFD